MWHAKQVELNCLDLRHFIFCEEIITKYIHHTKLSSEVIVVTK